MHLYPQQKWNLSCRTVERHSYEFSTWLCTPHGEKDNKARQYMKGRLGGGYVQKKLTENVRMERRRG